MTDNDKHPEDVPGDGAGEDVPRRVVGTPAPSSTRTMLVETPDETADPTLPEGVRMPDEKRAGRAEKVVAAIFVLAFLTGVGFFVAYFAFPGHTPHDVKWSNALLGASLAAALLLLAIGATIWVHRIMPHYEVEQEREDLFSDEETKASFLEEFRFGVRESGFAKRSLLRRTLMLAAAPAALAPLLLLWGLGPLPRKKLRHTVWKPGMRLVLDGTGAPIKATDFNQAGSMITVAPEGFMDDIDAMAKAAVIIIKLRPQDLHPPAGQVGWDVNGIVAYSKICTHVGCPAALYERTSHHILCPCHQSTFDATRGAKVIFGPAVRPLPQLPIDVDDEGYLVARSDFHEPVGPSFWERGGKS